MGRLAIAGLMGRRGFLSPRGSELVKAKSSSFGRQYSPCTLCLRRLWPGATLRLAPFLLHSLCHGFRQVWSKGLMPSANKPLTDKGEIGASAETVQTMWYGVSLVDDVELAKLVSSGALVEGQAFTPGKTVVPKPVDNRTVVYAVFFEAGLRFPYNVLLPEILRLFQVELPQLSPSALVRIAIFDWACRISGFEPNAELFGAIFFATVNSKTVITLAGTKKTVFGSVNFNVRPERSDLWPVNAAMSKWDRHWMILAAHCSTERTVRARLDGFKSLLRAKDDELGRKNLEMEALANTLKEAKAENKRLQSELEKWKEARAEVDRLKAELEKEKAHSAVLIDYYNLTEPKMESLRQKASRAEASAAEESRRFSREMAKTTESARTACQTLRLALTDMGAKMRGVTTEDASAFDFSEWTQQAGGSVSDCPTVYGDCCARVSAAFTMGLLQQFGCEHIAEFPKYTKGDWEISTQDISPALRAWRKQFWQKDGRSAAKARLLEQLAKAEAADLCEEEDVAAGGGGGDAQDHPEGVCQKSCIWPPSGSWRSQNEKFVALKGLPKTRCPFRPFYREMEINGRNYKVIKVANWLRAYPGRTLEDYDLVHSRRLEDMARF
uniref:OSJNBa0041M21.7 protein n=2 Tax=Oryza sativa TaxID=4530 RepID=Q7XVS9_ORYSJ|nr:OSJNBa0093P23.2 [Oryza sativa Japonica Group]CAD40449.2 OSJNBa0041M21.7 [Oryza sativa Japonica Group]CAH66265.1 OSIGBa0136B09.1 [Oryza sativa]